MHSSSLNHDRLIKLNATYGLNSDWLVILEIFDKNNNLNELLNLINIFGIKSKVNWLGTILKFLSNPHVHFLLSIWTHESSHAKSLFNVSSLIHLNRHALSKYIPLPDEQASSTQVRGELDTHFLFAMILERTPPVEKLNQEWFDALRLWIVIQSLVRADAENYLDEYIKVTADKIRLASEKLGDWFDLVKMLKPTSYDFSSISSYLSFQSETLLHKENELASSHKLFLRHLKFVATGQHKPAKNEPNSTLQLIPTPKIVSTPSPVDVNSSNVKLVSSPSDDDAICFVDVEADTSFSRQKLSANSVLILSANDAQFLPWHWNNLSQHELSQLNTVVESSLNASDERIFLIGFYTWLALKTGRTIRRVTDFQIGVTPQAEWTLSNDCTMVYRLPPHRKSDWQPSHQNELDYILPVTKYIKIELPIQLQNLLSQKMNQFPNASSLGELWSNGWEKPEKIFNELVANQLPRITAGMLETVLATKCFLHTSDDAITNLFVSHPQSGLPAACAYANWTLTDLQQSPRDLHMLPDAESAKLHNNLILFGSRLDVLENQLIDLIRQWDVNYEQYIKIGHFIQRHNAFIAYVVLMLMAATGIRNIRDPFESILHFDFEHHFVYVDDKALSQQGSGRLVPLPKELSEYIQTHYLSHLEFLSKKLISANQLLCDEIQLMLGNKPSGKLPFFFFLSEDNGLDWKSVSSATINSIGIFDSVLPANMFRHRLAKDLRRRGVSAEIVAGFLGHSEAGSESYGVFSHRNWLDDAKHVEKAINASFKKLPFNFKMFDRIALELPVQQKNQLFSDKKQFGFAARKQLRYEQVKEALRLARYDIELFLNGKEMDILNEDQFDQLCKKMLFHDNGIPRTYGYLRYEYLIRKTERLWLKQGKKVKIKRRYMSSRASSIWTVKAPIALNGYKKLREICTKLLQQIQPSKLSKSDATAIIPILIMLESRFCDVKALISLQENKSFRLIFLQNQYFLELPNRIPFDLNTPVKRIKISTSAAHLISVMNESKYKWQAPKEIPKILNEIYGYLSLHTELINSYSDLLKTVGQIVNQANSIALEGIRAGYLGGRVESYALNLFDWIKLKTGKMVLLEAQANTSEKKVAHPELNVSNFNYQSGNNATDVYDIKEAHGFFKELRRVLAENSNADSKDSKTRAVLVARVKALNKEKANIVSSSVLMIGSWVVHLLGKKIRKDKLLRLSSVERYLSALSPHFTDLAYNLDIYALDDEDVTELYEDILTNCPISARAYLGERLIDFDEYASSQNVESPDWSELPLEKLSAKVSPAIISNEEYHQALHFILKSAFKLPISNDALCMVLLLCYRFGLRGKEALGLLQSDFIKEQDLWIVLVQSNQIRKLKNRFSRRRIPLLFNLMKIEEEVIARHLAQCLSVFGIQKNKPLFYTHQKSLSKSEMKLVQVAINQLLKHLTGNPKTTLHHCRHTAINRIGLACIDDKLDGWKGRGLSVADGTKEKILSSTSTSRRTSWATARFLGHIIRDTQYRNYIHFLSDWCELVHVPLPYTLPKPSAHHCIEVALLPEMKTIEYGLISALPVKHVTVGAIEVLQYFRLLALGKPTEDALVALNISQSDGHRINEILKQLFMHTTANNQKVNAVEFFKMIKPSAWTRLLDHLEGLKANKGEVWSNQFDNCRINLADIDSVIGNTRQILLWNKAHFKLISAFLKGFSIQTENFKIVASNRATRKTIKFASIVVKNNLSSLLIFAGKNYQLDAVHQKGMLVESRVSVICLKNNEYPIRTSYELVMMFAIYVSLTINMEP